MRYVPAPYLSICLRDLRQSALLTQHELAKRSGVGEKTISSFESGARIDAMKLSQLKRIVESCGMPVRQFLEEFVEPAAPKTLPFTPPREKRSRAEHAHQLLRLMAEIEEDGHDALEVIHMAVGARTTMRRGAA